jgi:hypothetical protein
LENTLFTAHFFHRGFLHSSSRLRSWFRALEEEAVVETVALELDEAAQYRHHPRQAAEIATAAPSCCWLRPDKTFLAWTTLKHNKKDSLMPMGFSTGCWATARQEKE